jgi:spermidine synthase
VRAGLLYVTLVLAGACGLVYELALGAISTFFLGDTVTQFATVTGVFLSAMGVGAYATRFVDDHVRAFVDCQLGAAIVGGLSVPVMYVAFASFAELRTLMYGLALLTGAFVGAELPLLLRVLRRRTSVRSVVARALTVDYAGALVGSLAFAAVLLPKLGVIRSGVLFGAIHAGAAVIGNELLAYDPAPLRARALIVFSALASAAVLAPKLVAGADEALFNEPVVYAKQSAYQRIVLTRGQSGVDLFLDGNLQFAGNDEYRYHEALVHPALSSAPNRARVLVLGGGDGLALREIEKYDDVRSITLVDLDPQMIDMARHVPSVRALNHASFDDPRVHVVNDDAMVWLDESPVAAPFNVAVVDFPDPNNFSLGKLYTVRFYRLLRARLADDARIVVQSTSPLVSRRSFWCIVKSLEAAGLFVRPYHALVPAFGEWGYALAAAEEFPVPDGTGPLPAGLRYVTRETLPGLFVLSPDMSAVDVEPNVLDDQTLVRYYEDEQRRFVR